MEGRMNNGDHDDDDEDEDEEEDVRRRMRMMRMTVGDGAFEVDGVFHVAGGEDGLAGTDQ